MAYIADGKTLAPKGALVITEYEIGRASCRERVL